MALTITNAGSANSTTSSGSIDVTGVTAAPGDWLVVMVACDNSGTGGSPPTITCSDGANTYSASANLTQPGAATNDGVTLTSFVATVIHELSSATVTVSFSPNTASKTVLIKRIQPAFGESVAWSSTIGASFNAGLGTTPSITSGSISSGHTIIGFVGIEGNDAVTADSDTTNGSWSTQQTAVANTGTAGTSIRIASQQKTVTATATQTYNVSTANSRDWAIGWMSIQAIPTPALTIVDLSSASSATASTSLTISGITAAVGDMLIVMAGSDNSGTSGANPMTATGISDSAGNTWTARVVRNINPSSTPGTGLSQRSWSTVVTTALSSGTITIDLTTSTTSKAALVTRIAPAPGVYVIYGSNNGAQGTSTSPSAGAVTVTQDHTILGIISIEGNEAVTPITGISNGTWSDQVSALANTGTSTTSVRVVSQYKTVTATASQTYNGTISTSRRWLASYMLVSWDYSHGPLLAGKKNRRVIS